MAASPFSAWATNPYLQPAAEEDKPADNPFTTVSNVKSGAVDDRLKGLFGLFDQASTSGAGALADYTKAVKAATPAVTGQTAGDVGALDQLFSGQTAADQAAIRAKRKAAVAGVAARSLGDLGRLLGTTQLSMGGGGRSLGLGSFMARLGLDKAADINTRAAVDDSDAERADFTDLLTRRLAAAGQRQRLTDTLAGRNLLPYEAENQRLGALSSALAALGGQDLANKFVGLRATRDAFAI